VHVSPSIIGFIYTPTEFNHRVSKVRSAKTCLNGCSHKQQSNSQGALKKAIESTAVKNIEAAN
jgi:hypothetical protein